MSSPFPDRPIQRFDTQGIQSKPELWDSLPSPPQAVPGAPSLRYSGDDARPWRYIPMSQFNPDGDEFHYCREHRVTPVRYFQVEAPKDPQLAPVRTWATDEGEAKQIFHTMHRVRPGFLLSLHVTEIDAEELATAGT